MSVTKEDHAHTMGQHTWQQDGVAQCGSCTPARLLARGTAEARGGNIWSLSRGVRVKTDGAHQQRYERYGQVANAKKDGKKGKEGGSNQRMIGSH